MKNIKRLTLIACLNFLACITTLMACHEESDGWLRGHNTKWGFNFLSHITEVTTAVISTTTSCDHYTNFLQRSFQNIAENSSQGEGPYLKAFASFRGCPTGSHDQFQSVLRENYTELFKDLHLNGQALRKRFEKVLNRYPDLLAKCIAVPSSSYS